MKKRIARKKTRLNQLARNIGAMTARTEMAALEGKADLESRVLEFMARQEKALKRVADLHDASRRMLKEFKNAMRKAAAELEGMIRGKSRARKRARGKTRGRRRER